MKGLLQQGASWSSGDEYLGELERKDVNHTVRRKFSAYEIDWWCGDRSGGRVLPAVSEVPLAWFRRMLGSSIPRVGWPVGRLVRWGLLSVASWLFAMVRRSGIGWGVARDGWTLHSRRVDGDTPRRWPASARLLRLDPQDALERSLPHGSVTEVWPAEARAATHTM